MIKRFFSKCVPSIGSVFILIAFMTAARFSEPILMPVVDEFAVSDISYFDDKVIISGTLNQLRNCTFVDMAAYANYTNKEIPKDLLDYEFVAGNPKSRATGIQKWGPWRIVLPASTKPEQIELTATYRCHMLWDTTTTLTKFLVAAPT